MTNPAISLIVVVGAALLAVTGLIQLHPDYVVLPWLSGLSAVLLGGGLALSALPVKQKKTDSETA